MKFSTAIIFSLGCTLACHQALANKVYKWVDSKGGVHFSEQPPVNTAAEVVKHPSPDNVPVDYGVPSSSASVTATSAAKSSTPAAPAPKPAAAPSQLPSNKDPESCAVAQKNKESLTRGGRIKTKDNNGEFHYLTPEEQQQHLDETNKMITEYCE